MTDQPTHGVFAPCCCTNEHGRQETEILRQMVAEGIDQWEASIRLWGPEASLLDQRIRIRAWVRTEFQRAFPWLQLPDPASIA